MLEREGLRKPLLICFLTLVLLFAAGSAWDLQISRFLYSGNPSALNRAIGGFGELPAQSMMSAAGAVWIMRRGRSSKGLELLSLLLGVGLILFSATVFALELMENFPGFSILDVAIISVAVMTASCVCGLLLTRQVSRSDCFRFILTVVFVCLGAMAVIYGIKYLFNRPRMRLIAQCAEIGFMPWWKSGGLDKSILHGLTVASTDLRSFPSGHTVTAACSILWTLLPVMHSRFEGRGRLFLFAACIWTAVVAASRVAAGAHFLSDVTFSCTVSFVFYCLAVKLFYGNGKIFLTLYKWLT